MNKLYVAGSVYWILRDNSNKQGRRLSIGFMRQTNPPWKTGRGLNVRVGRYSLQIGFCKQEREVAEEEGLLYAMQGRELDLAPNKIGDWR